MATGCIKAKSHLFDRFDFCVFLIQAGARNTFPEVSDECVLICREKFIEFCADEHFCFGSPQRNIYQSLQQLGSNSIALSHFNVPFENMFCPT
jgi:hypothetical protein